MIKNLYVKDTNIQTSETNNYDLFKILDGNRTINLKNVNMIVESIKTNGLLPCVIIVNEKYEIIDGQHRFTALKMLNLPITFQVYEGLSLKDAVAMQTGRKWTMIDFVESYARLGNKNYKELINLKNQFPRIALTTITTVCLGKRVNGGRYSELIAEGKFVMPTNMYEISKKLEFLEKVEKLGLKYRGRKEVLNATLAKLLDLGISDQRMLVQLEKYGSLIGSVTGTTDAVESLEDVYNYRRANKEYFVSAFKEAENRNNTED